MKNFLLFISLFALVFVITALSSHAAEASEKTQKSSRGVIRKAPHGFHGPAFMTRWRVLKA